jgi:hypothetical protein
MTGKPISRAARFASAASRKGSLTPGRISRPALVRALRGADLVAEQADVFWRGPNERDAAAAAYVRKLRIFGQETVPGVDGVRAGDFSGGQQGGDVEVAFTCGGRANTHGLIRKLHMETVNVRGGVDGHGLDAQITGGADDPERNFTPVGNEDFFKHGHAPGRSRRHNSEQLLAKLHGVGVFHADVRHAPIHVRFNFVHELHGFNNAQGLAPF